MSQHLFVYGTLLFDDVIRLLTGRCFTSTRAVLRDHRRYNVCIPGQEITWPAIVYEPDRQVRGKLLMNVDDTSLAVIDGYENTPPEYEKAHVSVVLEDDREVKAIAYRALPQLFDALKGEWSKEEFERKHLRYYLTEKIPNMMAGGREMSAPENHHDQNHLLK